MTNTFLDKTPVALIFFARPDLLRITFAAIKESKPTKLFLIQDGAREDNQKDESKIEECREIVSNIDWECEVFRNYSDSNLGCGGRVYSGLSWAFQYVDRLLILEDDCVPSPSLFPFTADLLERYKNDLRMGMISGMNNLGVYEDCPNDYFFTTSGSIWGWATWKRVWDNVEYHLDFLKDNYSTPIVFETDLKLEGMGKILLDKLGTGSKLSSWSYQLGMAILLQHQMNIVPKYNMINNIGMADDGANSVNSLKFMPKGLRKLYYMKVYDYKFPLKHPKYVVNDLGFKKRLDRVMGDGHPIIQRFRKIESVVYRIMHGDFSSVKNALKRRFSKLKLK